MKYINLKIILQILLSIYFSIASAYGNFGDACITPPIAADYINLNDKNVYGYVTSQIDMTTFVPNAQGCDTLDGTISICIATPGLIGLPIPCQIIQFNANDRKKLFSTVVPTQSPNHVLKDVEFVAEVYQDDLCIFMPTSEGKLPVACKKVGTNPVAAAVADPIYSCKVSKSCYDPTANYSKSLFNFSGKAIHCVQETLDKILNPEEICLEDNSNSVFANINPFSYFQNQLKNAVRAALIMYVMFFGMRIVLNPYKLELNEIMLFILKVILVVYFSVGIGNIYYIQGGVRANDGITQLVLPMLLQIINDFPTMIFDASEVQDLCSFQASEYPDGYGFYQLWDSIDCRVSYYLGGEVFSMSSGALKSSMTGSNGALSNSFSFVIIPLMFLIFLGGNFILLMFCLIYSVVLISLLLFFTSSYLVCIVCLYTMAYIAPIFIPMVLFKKTKGYFDAWVKITISFALQPMILAGFITILTVFYDSAVFNGCKFNVEEIDGIKHFHIDATADTCQSSFGYKLYTVASTGEGIENVNAVIFSFKIYKEYMIFNGYLLVNLLFLSFLSIVFFFFSNMVGQIASDITGGVGISGLVVNPTLVMNKAKHAVGAAASKLKSLKGKSKGQNIFDGKK